MKNRLFTIWIVVLGVESSYLPDQRYDIDETIIRLSEYNNTDDSVSILSQLIGMKLNETESFSDQFDSIQVICKRVK